MTFPTGSGHGGATSAAVIDFMFVVGGAVGAQMPFDNKVAVTGITVDHVVAVMLKIDGGEAVRARDFS